MAPFDIRLNKKRLLLLVSAWLAVSVFYALLFEASSAAYFVYFSKFYYRPLYMRDMSAFDWRTEYEPWGAWHKPSATISDRKSCYDVKYTSNSIGARDTERASPGAPNSAIFLGDSFIEGFGVRDEDRLSNIFEEKTGKPSINLAAAGNVGPVQYWMLYNRFADQYAHDTVVVGLLPTNDFTDNDPNADLWKSENLRYRPYYRKTDQGYTIFHKGTFEYARTFATRGEFFWYLLNYTWTGGFWSAIQGRLSATNLDASSDAGDNGYFETSQQRIEATYYFLDKIVQRASSAKVVILIIPTYSEAKALRTRTSTWLSSFRLRFQSPRVSIVDLGPIFAGLSDDYLRSAYLECDGHWSSLGNKIASDALLSARHCDRHGVCFF